jgi:hypothetical protein
LDPASIPFADLAANREKMRAQRIRMLCVLSAAALGASLLTGLAFAKMAVNVLLLLCVVASLWAFRWARAGQEQRAVVLLLGSLTLGLSSLMWANMGLRDPAMAGYPSVLLFAALLGERRLFVVLLGAMLANIAAIGLSDLWGWTVHVVKPMNFSIITDHLTLIAITGMAVWWVTRDLHQALQNAEGEAMFKLFVRRDRERNLLPDQLARFVALKTRLAGG